jgi:hypothetical protein
MDLPGALVSGTGNLVAGGLERAGIVDPAFAEGLRQSMSFTPFGSGSTAREGMEMVTGGASEYQPQTTLGEYAKTISEFLPGGALAKAPVAAGLLPGLISEAAGQYTRGMTVPETVPVIGGVDVEPVARFAGALAGPSAANVARAAVTPNPADVARVQAAQRLRQEGVPVTAGQVTGSEALKYREVMDPRTSQVLADQNQAFTQAVLRRIGADADRATPAVMEAAKTRAGKLFDDAISGVQLTATRDEARDAIKVVRDYTNAAAGPTSPIIRNTANRVINSARKREPIPGQLYKEWRSQLSKLTVSGDTQLANAAKDMIDVLDNAMESSVAALGQAERVAMYSNARRNWQDYLAIETVASRAGEEAAAGIISPQNLRNAVVQQGKRPYVLGKRELGELARAGATVTGRLPQTGAFPRVVDVPAGSGLGTAAGAATFGLTGDAALAAQIGTSAATLPTLRNYAVGSPLGQAYLSNQLVTGRTPSAAALFPGAVAMQGLLAE